MTKKNLGAAGKGINFGFPCGISIWNRYRDRGRSFSLMNKLQINIYKSGSLLKQGKYWRKIQLLTFSFDKCFKRSNDYDAFIDSFSSFSMKLAIFSARARLQSFQRRSQCIFSAEIITILKSLQHINKFYNETIILGDSMRLFIIGLK